MDRFAYLVLLAAISLTGCDSDPGVFLGQAPIPSPIQVEVPVPEPPPVLEEPAAPEPALISPEALDLLIKFEVSSPQLYQQRYTRPICPLCSTTQSGVTIGIGYDLGQQPKPVIRSDWAEHPQVSLLPRASGVRGSQAISLTQELQSVVTPYDLAYDVFLDTSVVEYYRVAVRAFGSEFNNLHPNARGALVSVVYNRGGNTNCNTDSRREMCNIAKIGVPNHDYAYIAGEIRSMKRLWSDKGLRDRRDREAELVLKR